MMTQTYSRFAVLWMLGVSMSAAAEVPDVEIREDRPDFAHEASDLPVDPRIQFGELDNGLRYAIMQNDTPKGTASIRLRIAVGALDEPWEYRGIAHYLEHMAFNGSENIPEGEMIPRLERAGLSFGADTNAHTGFDETVYKLNLPNVLDATLDEAFMLMRETADKLTLDPDAIDRERGIILSEKRTRNTTGFQKLIAQLAFFSDGSGLTERLPIGTDETINNIDAPQMRAFYEAHYRPEKAFFVVVGDIDPDEMKDRISQWFGDWAPAEDPTGFARIPPARIEQGKRAFHHDEEGMTDVTLAVMHPVKEQPDTAETRAQRLLASLGNRMLSFRLSRIANEPDARILRGMASSGPYRDAAEVAVLNIGSQPDDWQHAIEVGEQELRRALEFGFSEAELAKEIEQQRADLKRRADQATTVETHGRFGGLSDIIVRNYGNERVGMHPADELAWFEETVQEISLSDVDSAFRAQWKGAENLSVFLSGSEAVDNPAAEIGKTLSASRAVEVERGDAAVITDFAFAKLGRPGKVISERHDPATDAYLIQFENNVRLNFKQTDFKANEVRVSAEVGDGALSLPRKDEGLRRLALNLLSSGGIADYPYLDLYDHFDGMGIRWRLFFDVDSDSIEISASTKPELLPTALELLTAFINEPGLQRDAGERYKRKIRAWYDTHDSTPGGVASKELPRLIRSGDRRFGFDDLDNFISAPYEEAATWLADQLDDGMIEMTIVGDIEKDVAVELASTTFGALDTRQDSRGSYPQMTQIQFPTDVEDIVTFWHEGEPDQVLLRMFWPAPDAMDIGVALQMSVLRAVFQNRLIKEIREESAATYSPGVGYHGDELSPDYGYVIVSLEILPESVQDTRNRIEAVAAGLGRGDITDDEFQRAIQPIMEDLKSVRQTNNYWMQVLADAQSDARGLEEHAIADRVYRDLKREDLAQLAQQVFGDDYHVAVQIKHSSLRENVAIQSSSGE